MNLLLDTCTLIWLASEPGQLSAAAAGAIDDPAAVLHASHTVSGMKANIGLPAKIAQRFSAGSCAYADKSRQGRKKRFCRP